MSYIHQTLNYVNVMWVQSIEHCQRASGDNYPVYQLPHNWFRLQTNP